MSMKTMIVRLAWKNIWRNKFRSSLILGAIAIGLFAGTFMIAFITGWMRTTIESDISNQLAHIQVHTPEFYKNYDLSAYFLRDEVVQPIDSVTQVNSVSYRLVLTGMLASATNSVGTFIKGVNVPEEKRTSTLYQNIPDSLGAFLTGEVKTPIVISQDLANKLKVRLKSKLILTIQDLNGDMQSIAFRIGGIFNTTNAMFDESTVFVRYSDIFPYTGLPEGVVHEAAIVMENVKTCSRITPQLKSALPAMDVQSWDRLQPALGLVYSWTDLINMIILSIFLVALSFGIVNTMLMAVLERTKELGVLACIGLNKNKIFRMIMLETLFLTLVGSTIGIIAAWVVTTYTGKHGIDLHFMLNANYENFGLSSIVYPLLEVRSFVEIVVLVVVSGILSAIYPARKALKINSWEATKS